MSSNFQEILDRFVGSKACDLFEYLVRNKLILQDFFYKESNNALNLTYTVALGNNAGFGRFGEAKVKGGKGTIFRKTALMHEALVLHKISSAEFNRAPDREGYYLKQIQSAANSLINQGIVHMLGFKYNEDDDAYIDAPGQGFNAADPIVIDAGGTAGASGVTNAWVIRWAEDGGCLGYPNGTPAGIYIGEPYSTNDVDADGNEMPVVCTQLMWHFAPANCNLQSVVKIKNLSHPSDTFGPTDTPKYLNESLILQALGMIPDLDNSVISIIADSTQISKFKDTLASKTNLLTDTATTDVGVVHRILTYGGAILRSADVPYITGEKPTTTTVPNVVGLNVELAIPDILNANLIIGDIDYANSELGLGKVSAQDPVADSEVDIGSAVDLTVSLGTKYAVVPDVVGMTQANATTAITAAGLVVGVVTEEFSDTVLSGNVISSNPDAGSVVPAGSQVDLIVSKGPQA